MRATRNSDRVHILTKLWKEKKTKEKEEEEWLADETLGGGGGGGKVKPGERIKKREKEIIII